MPEKARSLGSLRDRDTGSYEPPHLGAGHPTPILRKSNVCCKLCTIFPSSLKDTTCLSQVYSGSYPPQPINIHFCLLNTYRIWDQLIHHSQLELWPTCLYESNIIHVMAYLTPSLPLLSPVGPKTEFSACRRVLPRNTMSLHHCYISPYSNDSTPGWAHLLSLLLFTLNGMREGKSEGKCE